MTDLTSEAKAAVQPIKDWARSHVSEPISRTLSVIEKTPSSKADMSSATERAKRGAERLMRKYGLSKGK